MRKSSRLFEIIQILRGASAPMTADALAERLEVSVRTVYRDIAALQAMRTPIEGEAGIGYVMRPGYDLPPLNFDEEELEALRVGMSMLARSGDSALQRAAGRIRDKVSALREPAEWLQVAPWGAPPDDPARGCVSLAMLRQAVRGERKLSLVYRGADGLETTRIVRPVALIYHVECNILAAWCELRGGFRHFRTDRIYGCEMLEDTFICQGGILRQMWAEQEAQNADAPAAS